MAENLLFGLASIIILGITAEWLAWRLHLPSILLGETNPATSFVNHQIQVDPLREVYRRPRFTARSIVMGNQMLRFIRQIPTKFVEEQVPG